MLKIKKIIKSFIELLPDNFLINYQYFRFNRKVFNSRNIVSFSDRVFSWKLSGELYSYSKYVDKLKVREYVQASVGDEYLPKLLKVCYASADFCLSEMPKKFVLKLNNGCGYNLVVLDKAYHTNEEIRDLIGSWLRSDYYKESKEKQYKYVDQVVICEEFIESDDGLRDYKFYCINGTVEFIQVISERMAGAQKHNYYSKDWVALPVYREDYLEGAPVPRPQKLDEAIAVVEKLSKKFRFVRVDVYIEDRIYFGELTFTPGNGFIRFMPIEFDTAIAAKMKLEKIDFSGGS